jgi:hypothetical protein
MRRQPLSDTTDGSNPPQISLGSEHNDVFTDRGKTVVPGGTTCLSTKGQGHEQQHDEGAFHLDLL